MEKSKGVEDFKNQSFEKESNEAKLEFGFWGSNQNTSIDIDSSSPY